LIEKLANAGVGTIVGMHMSEKNNNNAVKHKKNEIIAGQISSDNLGINLMLDSLEKKYGVWIILMHGVSEDLEDKI
jgi:hypothetical protein